jgi:hypothetical protein
MGTIGNRGQNRRLGQSSGARWQLGHVHFPIAKEIATKECKGGGCLGNSRCDHAATGCSLAPFEIDRPSRARAPHRSLNLSNGPKLVPVQPGHSVHWCGDAHRIAMRRILPDTHAGVKAPIFSCGPWEAAGIRRRHRRWPRCRARFRLRRGGRRFVLRWADLRTNLRLARRQPGRPVR